jgi:hypothetical protein
MELEDPDAQAGTVVDAIVTPPDVPIGLAKAIDELYTICAQVLLQERVMVQRNDMQLLDSWCSRELANQIETGEVLLPKGVGHH